MSFFAINVHANGTREDLIDTEVSKSRALNHSSKHIKSRNPEIDTSKSMEAFDKLREAVKAFDEKYDQKEIFKFKFDTNEEKTNEDDKSSENFSFEFVEDSGLKSNLEFIKSTHKKNPELEGKRFKPKYYHPTIEEGVAESDIIDSIIKRTPSNPYDFPFLGPDKFSSVTKRRKEAYKKKKFDNGPFSGSLPRGSDASSSVTKSYNQTWYDLVSNAYSTATEMVGYSESTDQNALINEFQDKLTISLQGKFEEIAASVYNLASIIGGRDSTSHRKGQRLVDSLAFNSIDIVRSEREKLDETQIITEDVVQDIKIKIIIFIINNILNKMRIEMKKATTEIRNSEIFQKLKIDDNLCSDTIESIINDSANRSRLHKFASEAADAAYMKAILTADKSFEEIRDFYLAPETSSL